ncbi:MAG: glucose-6-phosphate isomerase [Candidatus Sumerlaeota bacterium]|nr:glucose-6-phosphate isomerase [Candidatus Sumerlaeota bacterium]
MSVSSWQRYKELLCAPEGLGLRLDISRMAFPEDFLDRMEEPIQHAFKAMAKLEAGAIANPDENRQVGHYWLRNPAIAPEGPRRETERALALVKKTASAVHSGAIAPPAGGKFENVLVVGIGGSALGPQFVGAALRTPADKMRTYFIDNTDPDGIDLVLAQLGSALAKTLVLVISKSGGTKETRNGMVETQRAFKAAGLDFAKQAIAITGEGSQLDAVAEKEGWLARIPMFDYIGGRTSEMSAVGLLPAALQGIDIDAMLAGAAAMDEATRSTTTRSNPAALLALMWHHATNGRGEKDMVVLPYKDRLELFSKYLQQLVMESLGKELDLDGRVVNQGIAVYGNKGSTDQHAYVQQLREGVNNFFVVFIEVLKDRAGTSMEVEPQATTGDYLNGFLLGTRDALSEKARESMTITVQQVDAATVGKLIALFERAVGLYATLVNINAYHQPGVEAGKKAAGEVLALQRRLLGAIDAEPGEMRTADEWAEVLEAPEHTERVWMILEHLAANDRLVRRGSVHPESATFGRGA